MLVIRLSRTGRKKQPYYRLVVAEKSAPIKGRFLEVIGHYNPRTKELEVDAEKAKARLANGAQPSETAEALLEKAGVLKREKITKQNRRPERKPRKEAEADEPQAEGEGTSGDDADPSAGEAETNDASGGKADDAAEAAPADDKPNDNKSTEDDSNADKGDS